MEFMIIPDVSGAVVNIILATIGLSLCVMACVEVGKFFYRPIYNKQEFDKWFAFLFKESEGKHMADLGKDRDSIRAEIDQLNVQFRGYDPDTFRLPRKLFMRRVENAVQTAQEYPSQYKGVLFCLSQGVPADLRVKYIKELIGEGVSKALADKAQTREGVALHANLISLAVERNLDTFQLSMSQRWLDQLRRGSVIAGFVVGILAAMLFSTGIWAFVIWILIGCAAGVFATSFHDILSRFTGTGTDRV